MPISSSDVFYMPFFISFTLYIWGGEYAHYIFLLRLDELQRRVYASSPSLPSLLLSLFSSCPVCPASAAVLPRYSPSRQWSSRSRQETGKTEFRERLSREREFEWVAQRRRDIRARCLPEVPWTSLERRDGDNATFYARAAACRVACTHVRVPRLPVLCRT